jgi:hypothetical protein
MSKGTSYCQTTEQHPVGLYENLLLVVMELIVPLLSNTLHAKRSHLVFSFLLRCCIFILKCLQRVK